MADTVTLTVENDSLLVTGRDELFYDRSIRLYFTSILGASRTDHGWLCPRRNLSLSTLIVRVNNFLDSKKLQVTCVGIADEAVQRDLERRRSYLRAKEAAIDFRSGAPTIQLSDVKTILHDFGWNEETRNLFPHQEAGLVHGLTAVNAANFSVPGAGKTTTSLAIAVTHIANGDLDCVMVVGPLSCFAPWEKETRAALGGRLKPIRIRGAASSRRNLYSAARQRDILLLSYATAAADKTELIELCRRMRVMLVVDESHRVKRFKGGLWAPALMEVARFARVKLVLSGTPMPQSGRDLYSQLRILWPAGELTGPADDFANRVDQSFPSVLADIRPFVGRTPKHALDLDPYIIRDHTSELTGTQAEIYALVENQFRRMLDEFHTWRDKIEALKRGKPIRLLQAASNPDLLNSSDGYYHLPRFSVPNPTLMQRLADFRHRETPAKFLTALSIVSDIAARPESGQKAVCWSNFVRNLDQFAELVRAKLSIPVFQIDGRVPTGDQSIEELASPLLSGPDTREMIIDRFLATVGPAVLITNPASTSESISLHSACHNAIYMDRTYDCALFLQSIDRIHRLGLRKGQEVVVHIIRSVMPGGRPTIDSLVDQSLVFKETSMKQLLEGAELAPLNEVDDPLQAAEGNQRDLEVLLKYLLGEEVDGAPV